MRHFTLCDNGFWTKRITCGFNILYGGRVCSGGLTHPTIYSLETSHLLSWQDNRWNTCNTNLFSFTKKWLHQYLIVIKICHWAERFTDAVREFSSCWT